MKNLERLPKGILLFSLIEIAIGITTLLAVSFSLIFNFNNKPPNVLAFVYTTSILSFILGVGLLRFNRQSYELLLFLAGVVVVSKILIFANILQFNGALETKMPVGLKNIISIAYHSLLWAYLNLKGIKSLFLKKEA